MQGVDDIVRGELGKIMEGGGQRTRARVVI